MQNKLQNASVTGEVTRFVRNSKNFIRNCKKPSSKDYADLVKGHLLGLGFLGLFGYVVKIIHMPIHNIIASAPVQ